MGYKDLRNGREPSDGKNAVLLLVCNNVPDDLVRNDPMIVGKPIDQRRITQDVDHAWYSAAGGGNQHARFLGEKRALGAHCLKAKGDIVCNLSGIQRPQMEVRRNALGKLVKFGSQ